MVQGEGMISVTRANGSVWTWLNARYNDPATKNPAAIPVAIRSGASPSRRRAKIGPNAVPVPRAIARTPIPAAALPHTG